ncbi:SH3 domain-containing protein [Flavobacterium sp. CBA20B-1]|uniref:SH3 domain-containing protein n=1 Tax=unclassified Flavobacterium TaxID=196869 RepID=UPI002225AA19|nr:MULTISPECIES: SH3 domain-containing protein [unclassified Flavobacterium]WCM42682.1 SH3 domain-containing protein [Flavobacterium sp. CBA20B-1]
MMMIFLLSFQFVFGQKTLKQIITEIPSKNYFEAGKKQGISLQNEPLILKKLALEPLKEKEYFITGKYEINDQIVLFISKYWITEDIHSAILLDKSLNLIDKIDEVAYNNAEGFREVKSNVDYNILTIGMHNIYHNPNYTRKKYSITNNGFKEIQDQVIITTQPNSGVNIRNKPTLNGEIIDYAPNLTRFNFLSIHYSENWNNKNHWIEIAETGYSHSKGYVFSEFTNRHIEVISNEHKIIIDEISKDEFLKYEAYITPKPSVEKITDIDLIVSRLNKNLKGKFEDDYYIIEKIIAENGIEITSDLLECGVSAYYPAYHYLLLECGHSSNYLVNLKNGKDDINRIGNPDSYLPSPQNTFRLNGYYNGQASTHFLEKTNANSKPEYLLDFSSILALDYIEKYFWINDSTLVFKIEQNQYKLQIQHLK